MDIKEFKYNGNLIYIFNNKYYYNYIYFLYYYSHILDQNTKMY